MFGECSQGTGTTVDARDTDRDDGNENDDVHEAVVSNETCILCCEYEWRSSFGIWVTSIQKPVISGANEKADEGEAKNIEPVIC